MRYFRALLLFTALLFFSGCSLFSGDYQTPGVPATSDEVSADFSDSQKVLEGRLDEVANGIAKPGEASPVLQQKSAADDLTAGATNNTQTMVIDKTKKYYAVLKTDAGDMTVEFTADKTPITVNNFITLAAKKFYDNTIFHRVIKGFMIQGGDPLGNGTGGPGYQFADEPFDGEYTRGTMAMANSGPNTNGSQFFIMHQDYALPKNYVIFGYVIQGLEVVDKIAQAPVTAGASGESSSPVTPVKILSVELYEK
ncbi:MAG: peptidylprolyl isomerase [Patescibacteria group bacterium]|nr:peptidylprolyl isomerase [Patescibacteria group bacterium]